MNDYGGNWESAEWRKERHSALQGFHRRVQHSTAEWRCRAESASFADSAAINGHRRSGERNAIPPYKDFTAAFNNQRRSGQKRSIPPYVNSICLGEGEEGVAVVFVLFAAEGDFGGQASFEVVDQDVKAVEDLYNSVLLFKRRKRGLIGFHFIVRDCWIS